MIKQLSKLVCSCYKYQIKSNKIKKNFLLRIQTQYQKQFFQFSNLKQSSISIQDILTKIDNYDSNTILNIFTNYHLTEDDFDSFMEIAQQCLVSIKGREDYSQALKICEIAINVCTSKFQHHQDLHQLQLKREQAILNFHLGKTNEAKDLALKLYAEHAQTTKQQREEVQVDFIKFLAEGMIEIDAIDLSKKYLTEIMELLSKGAQQTISSQLYYEILYLNLGCHYIDEEYDQVIKYGWQIYQQLNADCNLTPQEILIVIYICHKQLNQSDKQKEILELLCHYPNFQEKSIKQLDKSYFYPFRVERDERKNQTENEESHNSDNIWSKQNDKGQALIEENKDKEAMEYYADILQKLDPNKDAIKYINVSDRLAFQHAQLGNLQKAIEISLKSHQLILSHYNNKLEKNSETFQNLSYITSFYYKIGDMNETVSWGKKWHDYNMEFNLFSLESIITEANMMVYATALRNVGRVEESLEYCGFIKQYIDRFSEGKEQYEYQLYHLSFALSRQTNHLKKQIQAAIRLSQIAKALQHLYPDMKTFYFDMLKELSILTLSDHDFQNFAKYAQEYLQVRDQFEKNDESIQQRIFLLTQLGQHFINQNDFKLSEKYQKEAIILNESTPVSEKHFSLRLLLTLILSLQNKFDEGEKYILEATQIYEKHFKGTSQQLSCQMGIAHTSSIFYFKKGEFNQSLNFVEQYLEFTSEVLQKKDEKLHQDLAVILISLSKQQEYSQRVQNIINKYGIKL